MSLFFTKTNFLRFFRDHWRCRVIMLWLLGMTSYCVYAQLPYTENFDSDGEIVRYTTNASALGTFSTTHYFFRATDNPVKYPASTGNVTFGTVFAPSTILNNAANSGFWVCENVRGSASQFQAGFVVLKDIDVTNYTELEVSLKLADARGSGYGNASKTAENNDKIRIEYSIDGATWTTVGLFMGDNGAASGNWRMANPNPGAETPIPNGSVLTASFQPFTFDIPSTGRSLRVRVVLDQQGSDEEIAFDDIKISGTFSPQPTLADIESTPTQYNMDDPALQVTNAITVSSPSTIANAIVTVSPSNSYDELGCTRCYEFDITPKFNVSTRVLTLTGTATPANYQTALRSVRFRNTDWLVGTSPLGQRKIDFVVYTGTSASSTQSRIVSVVRCPTSVSGVTSQTVTANGSVTFSPVTNPSSISFTFPYQWQQSTNGGTSFSNITGQTYPFLVRQSVSTSMSGYQYRLLVSVSGCPAVTSSAATLTVLDCPSSVSSPISQTVNANSSASFNVSVTGGQNLTYQWQESTDGSANFTDLSGQTNSSLNLPSVSTSMNGYRYRVVVSSSGCSSLTSSAATLTVLDCPTGVDGFSDQTVNLGDLVELDADVDGGGDNLTYQWQQSTDGGVTFTNLSGKTSSRLSFQATSDVNGYQYRLVVSSPGCDPLTSSAATLTVRNCITNMYGPYSETVNVDDNVYFDVSVDGGENLTYQWQQSTDGGSTFTDLAGRTSASLSITAYASMNGYRYRVVVTSPGCSPFTSSAATLTVRNCLSNSDVSGLTDQTVRDGGAVRLEVTIGAGSSVSGLTYQWQRSTDNGSTFTNLVSQTDPLLVVSTDLSMNGYRYRVVISSPGCSTISSSVAILTVLPACPATVSGLSNQTVNVGQSANFTSTVSPLLAGVTYQWQQSTDNGTTFSDMPGETNANLSVMANSSMNGYQYRVVASLSGCTPVTSPASTLTVRNCITNATGNNAQIVNPGQTATFNLTITGGENLTYQWQQSTNGGSSFSDIAGQTNSSLSFPASLSMNGYQYRVIINSPGCPLYTSFPITLEVRNCPTSVTGLDNRTVYQDNPVTFTANVTGGDGLYYQWQQSTDGGATFSDITGQNTASLSLTASAAMNGYQYRVQVYAVTCSPFTSSAATLTVLNCQIPPITTQPSGSSTACVGTPFTARVVLNENGSTGGISYQWYKDGVSLSGATNTTLSLSNTQQSDAGSYKLVITGSCYSLTSTAFDLQVNDVPVASLLANGPLTCTTTSITLTASGGITYAFSGPGVVSSNPTAGTAIVNVTGDYSVTATSGTCSSTATVTVSGDQTSPTASLENTDLLTCSTTTVTLTASGGTSYRFSAGAIPTGDGSMAMVSSPGDYSVTVIGGNGCSSVATTTVLQDVSAPSAALFNNGPLSCTATSVTLQVSEDGSSPFSRRGGLRVPAPSATYVFSAGATQIDYGPSATVTEAGIYSVTVTGANGCTATGSTTVTNAPVPDLITVQPANVTVTAGQTAQFELAGSSTGLSYQWQLDAGSGFANLTNDATYSGVTSATLSVANTSIALTGYVYRVVVTSGVCSATSNSAVLTVNAAPAPDLTMLMYTLPTLVYGTTPVTMVIDVAEIKEVPTSGDITIKIAEDPLLVLSLPANANIVGGRLVSNSAWTLTGPSDGFYTLTTSQSIPAGKKLSVGLTGVLSPGKTKGSLSLSATMLGGSGGEVRFDNNSDADKIDYFNK